MCLHPQREDAENLLQQGLSIRRSAAPALIGVGAAALHRHWKLHATNRYSTAGVDPAILRNETGANPIHVAPAEKVPHAPPPTYSTAVSSAGGHPFCWCARCRGAVAITKYDCEIAAAQSPGRGCVPWGKAITR